ncbi:MAG: electron transfer flavoprotein subunit beta/FixA family protein [Candidatus Hadarchaeum sp.]|uniref:electron transfer flavoprotein subunit beta/FixA family protein n=1 Tax=Candidatus Hadarchaeum sp. TaxID=2883567 RepID=UPI003178F70C
MRILVAIKYVPDTDEIRINEATGTMIREGIPGTINPLDLYAIETALRLREQYGGEVVTISMGPPPAETALREALSMGVDLAFLLTDPHFAGADTWATAYTLSRAVKKLGPFDIALCGERATDGETSQVGPELGTLLDLPVVTYVSQIEEVQPASGDSLGWILCWRLVEEGYQLVEVSLPALLTVVKEIGEPRLPTFLGKLRARQAVIPRLTMDALDLSPKEVGLAGSPTRVAKVFYPSLTRRGVIINLSPEKAVEEILSFLKRCGLL